MSKNNIIKSKSAKCYIIGYIIVAALFLCEYVYYNYSVKWEIFHYTNSLEVRILGGSYITRVIGLWLIAEVLLFIIPIVSFLFKRKTISAVIMSVFSLGLHCCAIVVILFVGLEFDFANGSLVDYENFHRFEQPDGDIVLCTQDHYSMFPSHHYFAGGGTIYIETGHNTLKEVRGVRTFASAEYEYIEVTYGELERIKGSN